MTNPDQPFPGTLTWHASGGDGTRRGLFPRAVRLAASPARRLAADGAVQAAVVFDAQGTAFVADMAGVVRAYDSAGRERWRTALEGGVSAAPVVHPGRPRLFVGTHQGWLYGLETGQGTLLWRRRLPTRSDARILADLLFVPARDAVLTSSWGGRFCALAAESGEEVFGWDAGISPTAGAAADRAGNVWSLRAVTGQGVQLVRTDLEGRESVLYVEREQRRGARRSVVSAAPVLDEERGVAYFVANTDREGILHAWSLAQGTVLWTRRFSCGLAATPAVTAAGAVVVADLEGAVQALTTEGATLYQIASGCEYLLGGPVCDGAGCVFLGDPTGVLHRVEANGRARRLFEVSKSLQGRPSFDPHGNLHVPATDRTVYVFLNRKGEPVA